MTEAIIVSNEELAILCDIVGGWSPKLAENANAEKLHSIDRLIANGFVELANHSITRYRHTAKTELLFTQLCVGISGG